MPDFTCQRQAWSRVPVESLNAYVSSAAMLAMSDEELRALVVASETERYQGWRNYQGLWRSSLGLDTTHGKRVLDFGCGMGLEALQFARTGNQVAVADIVYENMSLAKRVLRIHGYKEDGGYLLTGEKPFIQTLRTIDVFYCNGVLHHIWYPKDIMARAWELLVPGGEARLMLYTDHCWWNQVGTEPPEDTENDPGFITFVNAMDPGIGAYADWYSADKVQRMFGEWFILESWTYLTLWGNYAAAILRRRD